MPIKKVKGGYKWGSSGKVYPTRAGAERQARAAYASGYKKSEGGEMTKKGLYANIHAKRKRIKAGSNEKMRKPGSKGAPTNKAFKAAAKTARKK